MARPVSAHIRRVRERLVSRLGDGSLKPGDRFPSNRAIASTYLVSYQTADRLVRELVDEGRLVRRAASGTYLPGQTTGLCGVQLIFHRRSRRKSSFGARLLRELTTALDRDGIDWRMNWFEPGSKIPARCRDRYLVMWEATAAAGSIRQPCLLVNDSPPPGLASLYMDSVTVDDFSGGACAAQTLLAKTRMDISRAKPRFAVLAGPAGDSRSEARVAGFISVTPAKVIVSQNWFVEGGLARAAAAIAAGPDGIFCCNDRLAEAIVRHCKQRRIPRPPLVGFDDAPIAAWLELTTIAIPWAELIEAARDCIRRRLAGDVGSGRGVILQTRAVSY